MKRKRPKKKSKNLKSNELIFKVPKKLSNMAYVDKNMELTSEGFVKGMIFDKIKGLGGFGYDPIFYVLEKNKTFAEMNIEEKNLVSHRSRAIKALKADLVSNLKLKENA